MALNRRDMWVILRARDEASRVLRSFAGNMSTLDRQSQLMAERQMARGRSMMAVGTALFAGGLIGITILNDMTVAAAEYTQQAAKAYTQTDNLNTSVEELKEIGKGVAREIPVAFDSVQESLYDIFSSMDVNVPEAQMLLEEFAKASVAGQVDIQTAGRGTISILNAWKMQASDVNRVNDVMFQLVRKGVGTYEEFSKSIGRAIPAAARAGQDFEVLAGMMAFMTRNGLSASVAATSAARALEALVNPKTVKRLEDMGIRVRDARGEFLPMPEILRQMNKQLADLTAPERAAALQQLFLGAGGTIQARRFFDMVFKNFDEFDQRVDEMYNSAGALEDAYRIMFITPQSQIQLMTNKYEAMRTEIGDKLMPVKLKLVEILTKLLDGWNSLSPGMQDFIVKGAALTAIIATLVGAITLLAGASLILTARFGGLIPIMKSVQALFAVGEAGRYAQFLLNAGVAAEMLKYKVSKIPPAITKIGKAAGIVGLALAGMANAGYAMYDASTRNSESTDQWKKAILGLNSSTDKATRTFENMFNKTGSGMRQMQDLDDVIRALNTEMNGTDEVGKWVDSVTSLGFMDTNWELARKSVKDFDDALSALVDGGDIDVAAMGFDYFAKELAAAGLSGEQIAALLPQYQSRLADMNDQQLAVNDTLATYSNLIDDNTASAEDQLKVVQEWLDMVSDQDAAFISLNGAYDAVIEKNEALAKAAADASEDTNDSWEDFVDQFPVTVDAYLSELQRMVDAQNNWEKNMLILSGRVSQDVLDELAKLGPEGAPLVAQLVTASDEQLSQLETLFAEKSAGATDAFADTLARAQPILEIVARTYGQAAASEAAAGLASGTVTIEEIMEQYKDAIESDPPKLLVDTLGAQAAIDGFIKLNNNKKLTVHVDASVPGGISYNINGKKMFASGGLITGYGGPTQDNIAIRASNGEYVMQASAVDRYGVGFMNEINAMRFRNGGLIGTQPTSTQTPVVVGSPGAGPAVVKEVSVKFEKGSIVTQEIDPRVHAAQLGQQIASRVD